MLIRLIVTLTCVMLFCTTGAYSWNLHSFSKDSDIRAALSLLENIGADEVFENLQENSVKIIFYDLSLINYSYRNHYAINSVDNWGERYILINSKYRDASKEEIACLIAHESFHKANRATMAEETLATQKEAFYWAILKVPGKFYKNSPLINRLNTLVCLNSESDENNNLIEKRIQNSKFYQEQLAPQQDVNYSSWFSLILSNTELTVMLSVQGVYRCPSFKSLHFFAQQYLHSVCGSM